MKKRVKKSLTDKSVVDIRNFLSPPGANKTKAATGVSKKKPLVEHSPKKGVKEEKQEKRRESPRKAATPKKTPTPKKKTTPKRGKKAIVESDEDEVNIIDEASDEDPIPSKKKKKLEDFIDDELAEEEDPIPKKKSKGKMKEDKVKRSSSGSSSKENSEKTTARKKDDKKKRPAASHVVSSSSEDEFQSPKPSKKKKGKDEQVNGRKKASGKKEPKEISSSDDEDDMRNVKKSTLKKKGTAKLKKKGVIFDSDSEDDSFVPPTQTKPKRERKKRGPTYVCDSDEEKPDIKTAFEKMKPKAESSAKIVAPQSPEKAKKQVSVMDFFGGATIHRVESKTSATASNKRKAESPEKKPAKPSVKADDFDMEIHDDDDFDATLSMLDEEEEIQKAKKARVEEPQEGRSPKKESLASKLAAKAKMETFVPETPEPKPSPKKKSPGKAPFKTKAKHQMEFEKKSPMKTPPKPATPSPKKVSPRKPSPAGVASASDTEKTPQLKRGGSYRNYLARAGPQALGSKEIPEGEPNCLEGLTFVITGVLESMERDEAKSLLEKYGGKVTGNVSKKTGYVVQGRDPGESKVAKAQQFGTKIVDEDGMLDLIRTLPGKKSKYEIAAEKEASKYSKTPTPKKRNEKVSELSSKFSHKSPTAPSKVVKTEPSSPAPSSSQDSQSSQRTATPKKAPGEAETMLWVDKYKPQNMKQIIGQQGDKSNAKKLLVWLKNWHKNRALGKKPAFNRFNDDGSGCKAALLSGPPGVGKTTTSTIVCKEAGFTYVELNASDTRSKKSLQTEVAELLGNHTLMDYMGGKKEIASSHGTPDGQNHCLIMDEVDGMAGNEDRGGMQELIQLIKNSKIPIICMCNDRNHQKIRSLANYCFDLRFQRPRVEQIKSAMMSMAFKEGIKIPPPALNEIILAANQDVRQVIHNMSMWSANDKSLSYDQVKKDANAAKKDMKLGPFDVCRKVFVGGEETARMTINDKSDLFFHDYQFGPLFVQENYPTVTPRAASNMNEHLRFLAKAADSIADGDLVDKSIRRGQKWSLLPVQAIYSSVIPGEMMRGNMSSMVQFPSWLGKNSSQNKQDRILSELRSHMCLKISGDKRSIAMDYISHFKRCLTDPLIKHGAEGARDVIDRLDEYDLLREDFDNILEAGMWPGQRNPMENVESKTKAAFTRQYNKESHMTPYAAVTAAKKGRGRGGGGGGGDGAELYGEEGAETAAVESDNEDSDNPDVDAMIKAKKKPTGKGRGQAADESSKGQGKGKGKGKGRGKGKK